MFLRHIFQLIDTNFQRIHKILKIANTGVKSDKVKWLLGAGGEKKERKEKHNWGRKTVYF